MLAVMLLFISPEKVNAETVFPTFEEELQLLHYPGQDKTCLNDGTYILPRNSSFSNVKSSNSKVAEFWGEKDKYGNVTLEYHVKKAGTTTFTFTIKIGNEKRDYKMDVSVSTYKNPVKTFKVGKKNYAKNFKKISSMAIDNKISGKIQIKPTKGWKIVTIKKATLGKYDFKFRKLKNGKKYTFEPFSQLIVICQNKKTKVKESVFLQVGYP